VPQSLQWPRPGSPDRLALRDPADEWPYWDELPAESVRAQMPYLDYGGGRRDYLHEAKTVAADYLEDTNIFRGRCDLPGGARVELVSFVLPRADVWMRRYRVVGRGRFVLQGEFFTRAVRGHPGAHLGHVDFRGILDAEPRGLYVLMSTLPLESRQGRVELTVDGELEWTVCLSLAADLVGAVAAGRAALERGFEGAQAETAAADRAWVARARPPARRHPFVRARYKRWLLANRLCTTADGATLAGPRPFWSFSWPRDSSLIGAAYAAAGFLEEARRFVAWHLACLPPSGIHEARYLTDGTPMLLDNRLRQGDNPGFVAWAAAFICLREWDEAFARSIERPFFAMADALAAARDPDTALPLPEADFREGEKAQTLSLVLSAAGGLKAAGDLARRLGDTARAARYAARAAEITRAIEARFWDPARGVLIRSFRPRDERTDIAVFYGAFPFRVWEPTSPLIRQAVQRAQAEAWDAGTGAILNGRGTPWESFWFYHSAMLLAAVAALGDRAAESAILDALSRNVSPQGLVPEQIGAANGHLWGCSYLTTAQGCLLLYAYMPEA